MMLILSLYSYWIKINVSMTISTRRRQILHSRRIFLYTRKSRVHYLRLQNYIYHIGSNCSSTRSYKNLHLRSKTILIVFTWSSVSK
ncbi:unnamed protein product [Adineta ricciae]|uniref:Uncharacterized protein n=1 Tax=Adineta ricciae TaxID=249248 RepID=A0A814D6A3_ADIRI|nr:unnamed protein product [Adineta ricciae]